MTLLSELKAGEVARIESLDDLHDDIAHRMHCLGFVPGAEVVAIRRAPLGDPAVYRVFDAEICLRKAEAQHIEVVAL